MKASRILETLIFLLIASEVMSCFIQNEWIYGSIYFQVISLSILIFLYYCQGITSWTISKESNVELIGLKTINDKAFTYQVVALFFCILGDISFGVALPFQNQNIKVFTLFRIIGILFFLIAQIVFALTYYYNLIKKDIKWWRIGPIIGAGSIVLILLFFYVIKPMPIFYQIPGFIYTCILLMTWSLAFCLFVNYFNMSGFLAILGHTSFMISDIVLAYNFFGQISASRFNLFFGLVLFTYHFALFSISKGIMIAFDHHSILKKVDLKKTIP